MIFHKKFLYSNFSIFDENFSVNEEFVNSFTTFISRTHLRSLNSETSNCIMLETFYIKYTEFPFT